MAARPDEDANLLHHEICLLETKLKQAKARLRFHQTTPIGEYGLISGIDPLAQSSHALHALLLLSDSALPLGSFAFSSGLESFLAHRPKNTHTSSTFSGFLNISLHSVASLLVPYVRAGFENPTILETLDNDIDASTTCNVARRASVAQGRALIAIWERCFRQSADKNSLNAALKASECLDAFAQALKAQSSEDGSPFAFHGHLPPLFGVVCVAFQLPLQQSLYLFLLNHSKTLVSAGIRSSIIGPYQAQAILASRDLQRVIWTLVERELLKGEASVGNAGQSVPLLDMWGGRHEIIYSRIFNS